MSTYTSVELKKMGFDHVGEHVRISRKASFYGIENITLGNYVRIDDFCVLSAGVNGIFIGNYIHIGCYSSIIGAGAVTLHDYCNISSRVSIYSSNDDYSGEYMTSPMLPTEFTNVSVQEVSIGKHSILGCGSVILPGVIIEEGCAIGALSLVNKSLNAWGVYAGQPVKYIKERSKALLKLEDKFDQKNRHKSINS